MKKEKDLFVAVLIDGDNASSEKMEDVMRFVSRYGTAVVRRIYGDWTKKNFPVGRMRQGIIRSGWCRLPLLCRERIRRILRWLWMRWTSCMRGGSVVFVWLPVTGIIPCWHNVSGRVA